MISLIFAPLSFWPFAHICLVPWLVAVMWTQRVAWTYLMSYFLGLAFWLFNLDWMNDVTPPGYIALSLYMAVYWPLVAWVVRHMVTRRRGSVALVLPFAWVGTEWLRAVVITGFPWFFLGHSHHHVLTMIQVSDLVGAYGVSFVIAAVNGWLVDMFIQPILVWRNQAIRRPRRVPVATVFTAGLLAFTVVYGRVQLASHTIRPGPRAAVCQGDFPITVSGVGDASRTDILAEHLKLSLLTGPNEPDLLVWPETGAPAVLNREFLGTETLASLLVTAPGELRKMWLNVGQLRLRGLPTVDALRQLLPDDPNVAAELRADLRRWYLNTATDVSTAVGLPPATAERLAQADRHQRMRTGLFFVEWDLGHLVDETLGALARGRPKEALLPLATLDWMMGSSIARSLNLAQQPDRPPAWIVTGGYGYEFNPSPPPPRAKLDRYNSAYVYDPSGKQIQPRYDKVHCVLFGEYVPFRYTRLHWLYMFLNSITPWGADGFEYSLTSGAELVVYEMTARSQGGEPFRFGIPICYEDVAPEICRGFVKGSDGRKRADFLLNLSNDGWFYHSWELPQHMVASVFRAVEHRVGVARAVNTGISGFIDPSGRVYDCVTDDDRLFGSGIVGARVSTIFTDTRYTLYTRWGDWFAEACAVLLALMVVDAVVIRRLTGRHHRSTQPASQN